VRRDERGDVDLPLHQRGELPDPFKLSRRIKKGRYTVTLTPEAGNFVAGTAVSAGKVSVPKAKPARRTPRGRYYL
jgi:hypothetical protein